MSFTAKDVQNLRQASGAGMMDAKRALEQNNGDFEEAAKWLREQGITKSAARTDRENTQGSVAIATGAAVPEDRARTMPLDVSAGQCVVSPIFEAHETVTVT